MIHTFSFPKNGNLKGKNELYTKEDDRKTSCGFNPWIPQCTDTGSPKYPLLIPLNCIKNLENDKNYV